MLIFFVKFVIVYLLSIEPVTGMKSYHRSYGHQPQCSEEELNTTYFVCKDLIHLITGSDQIGYRLGFELRTVIIKHADPKDDHYT